MISDLKIENKTTTKRMKNYKCMALVSADGAILNFLRFLQESSALVVALKCIISMLLTSNLYYKSVLHVVSVFQSVAHYPNVLKSETLCRILEGHQWEVKLCLNDVYSRT